MHVCAGEMCSPNRGIVYPIRDFDNFYSSRNIRVETFESKHSSREERLRIIGCQQLVTCCGSLGKEKDAILVDLESVGHHRMILLSTKSEYVTSSSNVWAADYQA
jgi:uncharacterized protein (DUF2252 family)